MPTTTALWVAIAILSVLLVLATGGLFLLLREIRLAYDALSLWRNRAFRLRGRLHEVGGNWRFDRVPGDVEDVG